eukprot:TRINITY_DN10035_c0_g1_i1.p1 TRINITY_DN10035_c0_g1~~TRINITY_DN10035_c0_g1_i1.p1  ORF type:complete len:775 (+),score=121.90 TRINITY_DN10035_c0_g1_i1:112-2436(+)
MPNPVLHKRSALNPDKWLKWFFYLSHGAVLVYYRRSKEKTETKTADSQTPTTTATTTATTVDSPKRDGADNLPQGTIGLKNALISEYYHDEQHPHCIVIVSSTRVFYLAASSERRQREWIKELLNQPIEFGITLFDAKARLSMIVKPSSSSARESREIESESSASITESTESSEQSNPSGPAPPPSCRTKFKLKDQRSRHSTTPTPHTLSRKNLRKTFDCANFYCGKSVVKDSSAFVCEVCESVYHPDCASHAQFNCYSIRNFVDPDHPEEKTPFDLIHRLETLDALSPVPTSPRTQQKDAEAQQTAPADDDSSSQSETSPSPATAESEVQSSIKQPRPRWLPAARPSALHLSNIDDGTERPKSPLSPAASPPTSPRSTSPPALGESIERPTSPTGGARPKLPPIDFSRPQSPPVGAMRKPGVMTARAPGTSPKAGAKKVALRSQTGLPKGPPPAVGKKPLAQSDKPPPLPPKPIQRNATSPSLRSQLTSVPPQMVRLSQFKPGASTVSTVDARGGVLFRLDDPRVSRTVTIETKPILFEFGKPGDSPPQQRESTQTSAASSGPLAPVPEQAPLPDSPNGTRKPQPEPEVLVDGIPLDDIEALNVDNEDDIEVLDDPSTYKDFAPPPSVARRSIYRKSAGSSPVPLRGRSGSDFEVNYASRMSTNSDDISILGSDETSTPRRDADELNEIDSEEEIDLKEVDEMFDFLKQAGIRVQPKDTTRAVRATLYLKDRMQLSSAELRKSMLRYSEQLDIQVLEQLIESLKTNDATVLKS